MNKKKLIFIIIAAILVVALAAAAIYIFWGPGDFHRAKWGMSMDQVKARESAELANEEYNSLAYPLEKLEGIPLNTTMFYKFDSSTNALTHVSIGVDTTGFEDKKISRLISTLTEKHGDPEKTEQAEILYSYVWKTDRTKISVTNLSGYTLIVYSDVTIPMDEE